jgi:hypothetical protein
LLSAGFDAVEIIDAGKDLNAYALVANQAGCCSPAMPSEHGLNVLETCCSPAESAPVHEGLADLLRRYDINEFAASVYVYALKSSARERD